MAIKPKKANKIPAGERPKQLSGLAKTVKRAARGGVGTEQGKPEILTAGEAGRRADVIRKKEAKAKAMAKSGKASTSYSPSEMSKPAQGKVRDRAMKKQLSKYGMSKDKQGNFQLNSGKTKRSAKAGSSTVSKVVGRAKTVAREARDIPTAVGTAVSGRNVYYGGGKFAKKDLKTQIKEVGSAIKSGKKGTEAAQVRFGGRKKGTVGAGGFDQNVSKKKAPRK